MRQLLVFLAACAGGAINSVAGGGTLLTVPTLIWLGVPALNANATSTVALWPGSLSGAWDRRPLATSWWPWGWQWRCRCSFGYE